MALVEPIKKGGRYTKREQEQRRLQVFQLSYVEDKSSAYIAKFLEKNRNTINADIQFLHTQILQKSGGVDFEAMINQAILEKKIQKERLLDDLEEAETIDEKIKLEKFIFEIDNWLAQFYTKALSSTKDKALAPKKIEIINEDEIKEFVREVILHDEQDSLESHYSEEKLKLRYLFSSQSNVKYAEKFIQRMKDIGLDLCKESVIFSNKDRNISEHSTDYDLILFGAQRGYLTIEEQRRVQKRQDQIIKLKNMEKHELDFESSLV